MPPDAGDRRPLICFPFVGDVVGGSHVSALGLIRRIDPDRFRPLVLVQHGTGAIAALFAQAGVAVEQAPASPDLVRGKRITPGDVRGLLASIAPLARALRRLGVAVVHTNDGRTHATWALPARIAGARFIWHHRSDVNAFGMRFAAPLLAHQLIAVSDYAGGRARPNRRSVIHSPFDTDVRHDRGEVRRTLLDELRLPPDARPIAFSGALIARKRPLTFIAAIAELRRRHPDLNCHGLIFGEALEFTPDALMRHAADLGVGDAIHVMGFRADGQRWLAGCDALLVPAIEEPFGRTLIEAMLVGTPVVATRSGGNAEALEDGSCGPLVPVDDPAAMAAALADLLTDPAACRRMTTHAMRRAQARFGTEQHARHVMAIYDRLLAVRPSGRALGATIEGHRLVR